MEQRGQTMGAVEGATVGVTDGTTGETTVGVVAGTTVGAAEGTTNGGEMVTGALDGEQQLMMSGKSCCEITEESTVRTAAVGANVTEESQGAIEGASDAATDGPSVGAVDEVSRTVGAVDGVMGEGDTEGASVRLGNPVI